LKVLWVVVLALALVLDYGSFLTHVFYEQFVVLIVFFQIDQLLLVEEYSKKQVEISTPVILI